MENKTFIVVARGYEFIEAIIESSDSKENAILSASKKMKADEFILAEQIELLDKFKTNIHSSIDGWSYIAQMNSTVKVGFVTAPSYNIENPHPQLDVCVIINLLINPFNEEEKPKHIVLGKRLPDTTISASCYYCGDGCADAYF